MKSFRIVREENNEKLIKRLGDEIIRFQEILNIEKKVKAMMWNNFQGQRRD